MTTAPGNAATAANTRFRLTRRGRIVLTTIAATPLVVAAIMLALNGGIAEATTPGAASSAVLHAELVSFRYVTVAPGQTLWNLAESIAPSADPRDVIVDIIDLNQLQGDSVQPGQRLTLPAGY
ncbi:LysM peptidoglycan-binding domain-containing protein [Cryobacterium psychrophilum]|uniref:LysM peptidoglycan-binding domain-containing protein n=2 Tax=Cryobacterium psychrophilum TaxID=41988 RepID=A0A4Y8KRY4_9MICO|nr:LysM peptidoglycan-binding domain-containing protein [Cryobacterium psychrophilum]TFD79814.1 LysM peptidoglycan-binding domain-containing protein [Cryobacterium psychrophilum]